MSRRKTKPEEIRNPEHYFNKYIAMEVKKDQETQQEYNDFFCSLEEKLEGGEAGQGKNFAMLLSINVGNAELERSLADSSLLAWIDYIENQMLHRAIKQLPREHQILLTLRYKLCLTQRETAEILNKSQASICTQERRLLKSFQKSLLGGYQKP